jgi:hypothetical protein
MTRKLTEGEQILSLAIPILIYNQLENVHGRELVRRVMAQTPPHYRGQRIKRWAAEVHLQMVGAHPTDTAQASYKLVSEVHDDMVTAYTKFACACRYDREVVSDALSIAHRFAAREAGQLAQVEAFRDYYLNEVGGDLSNLFL